jgi:heme exporter protein D
MMGLNLQWASWADFWAMGGYGLYVWGSFGVTAAAVLGEVLAVRHRRRALQRQSLAKEEDGDTA